MEETWERELSDDEVLSSWSESSIRRLSENLTATGTIMGTPTFMAPEQHFGVEPGPAADQYSFCVSLYQALYGRLPFAVAEPASELAAVVERKLRGGIEPPPPDRDVPGWLYPVIARGLASDPQLRHPSMNALIAALEDNPTRRRRARARLAAFAGVSLIAVMALAALGWTSLRNERGPVCQGLERELDEVWNEDIKGEISAAFARTGLPYAADTVARVSASLDDYASSWLSMRTDVCVATRVDKRQPENVLFRRVSCLERRRNQLGALAELFASRANRDLVNKAVSAAQGLPPIDYCGDIEALTAAIPPPEDPLVRARVEALEPRVDRLEVLLEAGKFRDGIEHGEALLADMADLDYAAIRARTMHSIALLKRFAGDYNGAEAMLGKAIPIAARAKDDALVATLWANLIDNLVAGKSRPHEAEVYLQALAAATERTDDELARAASLSSVAGLFQRVTRYREARAKYEESLAIRERVLGPDHLEVAMTLNSLAWVLDEMGHYEQALTNQQRALTIREAALGFEHPHVAESLHSLANTLGEMGKYEEARVRYRRALSIEEKTLGPDHPDVATALGMLGHMRYKLGRYEQARANHQRSVAIKENALGRDHLHLSFSLHFLALVFERTGNYESARAHVQRALAIAEKALGPEHPMVAMVLGALAAVLGNTGNHEQARATYQRALTIHTNAKGTEHPDSMTFLTGLGRTLIRMNRLDAAEPLIRRALSVFKRTHGSEHPELARPLLALGELFLARHRPDESARALQRALALDNHNYRAEIQLALARALWAAGSERARAIGLARQAREHFRQIGNQPMRKDASCWLAGHAPTR
ncbi:MAG: tetratricopeptide repeat-containing serine/threonine-protein kinase [Proteobacteria bacterium]|nr:tetratricopeptide repeat-containing serine/threonine-protein kinase [Pseudomonadota bacterium]